MTDVADAARRVAVQARVHRICGGGSDLHDDLIALLPVLDAVAAGQGDEGRVERYARAICRAEGWDPDGCLEGSPDWMYREAEARAAIALADAERAAGAKHFPASVMHEALAAAGLPVEAVKPIDGAAIGRALKAILAEHPDKVEQARANPAVRGWFVGKVMAACRGLPDLAFVAELVDIVFDPTERRLVEEALV